MLLVQYLKIFYVYNVAKPHIWGSSLNNLGLWESEKVGTRFLLRDLAYVQVKEQGIDPIINLINI